MSTLRLRVSLMTFDEILIALKDAGRDPGKNPDTLDLGDVVLTKDSVADSHAAPARRPATPLRATLASYGFGRQPRSHHDD